MDENYFYFHLSTILIDINKSLKPFMKLTQNLSVFVDYLLVANYFDDRFDSGSYHVIDY